jgi:thymidylate synthase (FAD)
MKADLIQTMGSDLTVVNAARVSFAKESDWDETCECGIARDRSARNEWPGCGADQRQCARRVDKTLADKDARLIRFLARHNHWTPFGHCSATFRISAPIFVARQLGKHQVGLVWNEVSRRYVDEDPEFYTPEKWRKKAADKKQGSLDETVTGKFKWWFVGDDYSIKAGIEDIYDDVVGHCQDAYNTLIKAGVCPEQARMVLPQSMMTEWYWTGSLAAFARVANLRLKPDTQAETRVVADLISKHMTAAFPVSWAALTEKKD